VPLSSWLRQLRAAKVTLCLVASCVLVFVWAQHSEATSEMETLLRFGASARPELWRGQTWRLVSAMFLHMSLLHLGWNSAVALVLCPGREAALGRVRFLGLYLVSGVAGSALSAIGQDLVSAGASGALFGVMGARLVAALRAHTPVWLELGLVAAWFVVGAFAGFDNLAHLGGLGFGALWAWAVEPVRPGRRWPLAVAVAVLGGLVIAASRPLRW
jgi:rhomboid protease GluP